MARALLSTAGRAVSGSRRVPELVNISSTYNASSATCVINKPTGVQDGDVMVACVIGNSATNISAPAGWTGIDIQVNGAFMTATVRTFYKVANSEGASYTFTPNFTDRNFGAISAWRGCDILNPIHGHSIVESTTVNATAASVTVTENNVKAVYHSFMDQGTTSHDVTPPSGYSTLINRYPATQPAIVAAGTVVNPAVISPSATWATISSAAGTALVVLLGSLF